MTTDPFLRLLAAWALVHETADEGWKAAVARGDARATGEMKFGPDAFVDGLSALIAKEKDALKAELASGTPAEDTDSDLHVVLAELRFEIAELRGRIESLQASVDGLGSVPGR